MRSKLLLTVIFLLWSGQALFAAAAPTITSFSPAQGPVGTLVTLTGTNLGSPTAFSIGGVTAVVVSNTGTQLVGLVMPGAVPGVISITASGATANSTNKFTVTATPYPSVQQATLSGTQSGAYSEQGAAVALSADGNTALVGSPNNTSGYGASFVFIRTGTTWTQQAELVGTPEQYNYSMQGNAVALSADGNTAMVGARSDGYGGVGAVWFFTRIGTTWTQQGSKVIGTGAVAGSSSGSYQGTSVSLSADGNTAIEGGPLDNSGVGAAWVFTRSGGIWSQSGSKLVGTGGGTSQGAAVALSANGSTAIVGSSGGAGGSYIYIRNANTWTQQGNELVGTGTSSAQGGAVALSADGNTALVGGPGGNGAWAFTRTGSTWSQQGAQFMFPNGSGYVGAELGSAVSLSADGNVAIVGGSGNGNGQGGTWIYTRSGGIYTNVNGLILGAGNNASGGGQQGSGVAMSATGGTALIGAPGNNNSTGLAFVFAAALPAVVTESATEVTATTAELQGYASANGFATTISFEYGTSPTLAGSTTTTTLNLGTNPLGANQSFISYAAGLTGLTAATEYYFRIDGTSINGTAQGAIMNFTTSAAPPPPPPAITFLAPASVTYGSITTPTLSSTDPTQPFNFRSGNPDIVTVNSSNQIVATGVGSTYIVAYQYAAGTTNIEAATSVNITVYPAPLTITPNNLTVPFGQPIPTLAATYSGFVNGETTANFSQQAVLYTNAQQGYGAGTYNIFVNQVPMDPNYSFTLVDGTLTITPAFPSPSATTVTQTNVTATGATLNGTANGNGADATVIIQYTTDDQDGLGNLITATLTTGPNPLPGGAGTTNYSAALTGLQPNTTYYYFIEASNTEFSASGNVLSFTTPAAALVQTITFPPIAPVNYGYLRQDPGATSTNTTIPITYTSSNPAVAIITNGQIQLVGVGTTIITASQAGNATYAAATPVSQDFTVNPLPLTITADDKSKPLNSANPALTITFGSFANGDTPQSLTTQPTISTTATISSGVGTYPITVSGAVDPNYTFVYVAGTLTVTPIAPTSTTQAATLLTSTGATLNGVVNDDGAATTVQFQLGTDPTLGTSVTEVVTTGTNPILPGTGNSSFTSVLTGLTPATTYYFRIYGINNYGTTYGNILSFTTSSIPVALITFTTPTSAVYGSADLTPNGTSNNSGTPVTYTSSNTAVATITSGGNIHIVSAGTTQITASQAASGGYTAASPVSLTFTVAPAPLTVTAHNETKVYGSANPFLAYQYKGFVNGDDSTRLSPQATVSTTATSSSGVGTYPITLSGALDPDYSITYVDATLTITPAALTITANNQTKVQGTANPALTAVYTGFVNNNTADDLSSQLVLATTATTSSEAGTYAITVSGAADPNYTITYVPGRLTITPPLVFNQIAAKTYGDPDFNPGATGANVTYSSGNTTVATITNGGDVHIVGAGSVTITASSGGSSLSQTVVINPAPLTITANDQSRTYGADDPALTLTYTGFVYSDDAASLTTAPAVATTAAASSDVGTYPITASGAADPNYTITYAAGKLSVTPAALTITANDQTKVQGAPNPLLTVTYTGFVNNNTADDLSTLPDVETTALTSSDPGTYPITVSGAVDPNYTITYVSGTLTILPPPTLVANNVLTPNGDGVNDVWIVHDIQFYPDNNVTIYDRAGRQVYSAHGYNNDWGGTSNGKPLQEGTYYYVLVLKPDLPYIRGFISIIRSK